MFGNFTVQVSQKVFFLFFPGWSKWLLLHLCTKVNYIVHKKHSQICMPVNMTNNNIANTTKLISTLIREQNPGAKRELLVKLTPLSQLDFWLSVFCVFSTWKEKGRRLKRSKGVYSTNSRMILMLNICNIKIITQS